MLHGEIGKNISAYFGCQSSFYACVLQAYSGGAAGAAKAKIGFFGMRFAALFGISFGVDGEIDIYIANHQAAFCAHFQRALAADSI